MKNTHTKRPIHHKVHRHLKLTFVPHVANQFRPHLVRSYGILVILGLVGAAFVASNPQLAESSVLGSQATVSSEQLLDDTNAERTNQQLQPLAYNETLAAAAFLKAQDMFKEQYWAHTSPKGATPWQWFAEAGYNYAYAGENLAKNFTTADAAVTAWMGSPDHRKNILNAQYTEVGFAVADGVLNGKHAKLIVALYGAPAAPTVAGALAPQSVSPAGPAALSPITRFGVAVQSMTPAVLGSVVLLLFAALVAIATHAYRHRLPKPVRMSWRYHHGLYKSVGLTAVAVVLVALYSGGQI